MDSTCAHLIEHRRPYTLAACASGGDGPRAFPNAANMRHYETTDFEVQNRPRLDAMDPQCDDYWLFMGRIVEMYGRCGFDRERAWRWLNNMYWRGQFEPYARSTISDYPMIPRRQMLAVWRECDHPGIRFCCKEIPVYEYDDGAIKVDLFKDIVLPDQTDAWTEQHCNVAYKILAHVDQSDIEPVCLAGLMCQFVGSYELLAICHEGRLDPPPFLAVIQATPQGDELSEVRPTSELVQH
jgi:hypothetical protein